MLLDLLGAKRPMIRSSKDHKTDFLFDKLIEIGKKIFEIIFLEDNLHLLGQLKRIPKIFYPGKVYGIEDDHLPFLRRGNIKNIL